jgi:hypothetical protein
MDEPAPNRGPARWAVLEQLRTRAEALKLEFNAASEPEKRAALQRWQQAVNEFTDVLLGARLSSSE